MSSSKPIVLHLGDDVRWNHDLYAELQEKYEIKRSYSMGREDFKNALKEKKFGDFVAMYRPFWNTGGEMGKWDEELISLLPSSCKISASAGAGFDWVDTSALARRGVIYCNSAAACTESVADTGLYLILNTFRKFTWTQQAARSCDPSKFTEAHRDMAAIAENPNGKTLGIIGLGKIGYRIAEKAYRACEMRVVYNDVVRMEDREKDVEAKYYEKLEDMLAVSDCVVLATPFAGEKVLHSGNFGNFKKGGRLVNIARGKLIEEPALVEALENGHLSAAALDVHYDEPNVNPKLAGMWNVEVMSHTAGGTVDSHIGFERLGIENILQFLKTGEAITPVNAHLIAKEDK